MSIDRRTHQQLEHACTRISHTMTRFQDYHKRGSGETMEIVVDAQIEAVTVYTGRAQVLRRAHVQIIDAGEHTLKIGGLPLNLQRSSLRAQGRGPAGTRILGIEQESEIHAAPPVEQLERLTEEITRLRREIERTVARQKIIEEQREWLRTLG